MRKFIFVCDVENLPKLSKLAEEKKWADLQDALDKTRVEYDEGEAVEAKVEYAMICKALKANDKTDLLKEVTNKLMPLFVEAEYYEALVMIWKERELYGELNSQAVESLRKYYRYLKVSRSLSSRNFSFEGQCIKEFSAKYEDIVVSYKDKQLMFYKNGKKHIVS